jgi:hypothetical protein
MSEEKPEERLEDKIEEKNVLLELAAQEIAAEELDLVRGILSTPVSEI